MSVFVLTVSLIALLVILTDAIFYLLLTPEENPRPFLHHSAQEKVGYVAFYSSYVLSLLRLPFAILPYATKLLVFLLTRKHFHRFWRDTYSVQLLRIFGDLANLLCTTRLLHAVVPPSQSLLALLVAASILAEAIRLITEKGQMLISASWQMIPHQAVARYLQSTPLRHSRMIRRYISYYRLDDSDRLDHIVKWLRSRSRCDIPVADRLSYTIGFRIVPNSHGLGAGKVRDVAAGEVFIHQRWTNDPWLLIGQAMRRGAWLFDPRYLQRPFHYRTQSNRLATLFVLTHPAYSPPYTWYQLGHEIKVARYHVYHALLARLGFKIEQFIQSDGTYLFDPLLIRLAASLGWMDGWEFSEPMKSNEEVIHEIIDQSRGECLPSAQQIAETYCYPIRYVEEVLIDQLNEACSKEPFQTSA